MYEATIPVKIREFKVKEEEEEQRDYRIKIKKQKSMLRRVKQQKYD